MGVGAPGQSESSCALISMSGCHTSLGMTTGTPLLLRPMGPAGATALFLDWAQACEGGKGDRTGAVSPIGLRARN